LCTPGFGHKNKRKQKKKLEIKPLTHQKPPCEVFSSLTQKFLGRQAQFKKVNKKGLFEPPFASF